MFLFFGYLRSFLRSIADSTPFLTILLMSHNGRSYVNWNFNGLIRQTSISAVYKGVGCPFIPLIWEVCLFASWHNGALCDHSKICSPQAGAAVGVEPPQAAERPGAYLQLVLLKFSLVEKRTQHPILSTFARAL